MKGYIFLLNSYMTDFIKMWLVFWGIMNISLKKKKSIWLQLGICQAAILTIGGCFYKNYSETVTVLCAVLVITAICCLFEENIFKKMAYSLLAYILIMFLDACIVGIFSIASLDSNNNLTSIVYSYINILTLGVIVWFRKRHKKFELQINISRRIYMLLFAGAGTGIVMIAGLTIQTNNQIADTARRATIIITIIVMISYCAACMMMIFVMESRDNYKALSAINQNIIESQQQYYTLVKEKQEEIRSIRHEMKNHLACIRSLYQADKLSEMERYINELVEASDIRIDLFDTGNDIVNAILNDAQSRFRKDNIEIRLEGGFPQELYVAPMDLCVIFANLISNAVEAVQGMENAQNNIRYVDLKISSFKNDLYIDMKNPTDKNIRLSGGSLITTKKDKTLHGFGIKNVIQRVEKYHGTYHFKLENNQFYVEIFLKNER